MEITIFAKRRTSREGKKFNTYLTTLERKDGTTLTTSVKFAEPAEPPKPEECPCNIVVKKMKMNLSKKDYIKDNGETGQSFTLWIKEWSHGSEYVDHSLDEFF